MKKIIYKQFVSDSPWSENDLSNYLDKLDSQGYQILDYKRIKRQILGFGEDVWKIKCSK
jgi:hypothetical protein